MLLLLASLLMGLTLATAPGARDEMSVASNTGIGYRLSAQESPLSPLSIAFNDDAAVTTGDRPLAGEAGAGGPSNLLRVLMVIAGVLLVTGVVFWRQR